MAPPSAIFIDNKAYVEWNMKNTDQGHLYELVLHELLLVQMLLAQLLPICFQE